MDSINKSAARFREVRQQLKLTQQGLAERLRLKRNTVAKIESGHTLPSARTLSDLEGLLIKSNNPPPERDEIHTASEDGVPYGEARLIEAELRARVEEAITAAAGDRIRLAWLLGQANEHLRPPTHWAETPADLGARKLAEIRARLAAQRAGGDPRPSQQQRPA